MGAAEIDAVVCDQPLERQIDFADQQPIVEFIDHRAQLCNHLLHFGLIG